MWRCGLSKQVCKMILLRTTEHRILFSARAEMNRNYCKFCRHRTYITIVRTSSERQNKIVFVSVRAENWIRRCVASTYLYNPANRRLIEICHLKAANKPLQIQVGVQRTAARSRIGTQQYCRSTRSSILPYHRRLSPKVQRMHKGNQKHSTTTRVGTPYMQQ